MALWLPIEEEESGVWPVSVGGEGNPLRLVCSPLAG
jgi:hypothetical protein